MQHEPGVKVVDVPWLVSAELLTGLTPRSCTYLLNPELKADQPEKTNLFSMITFWHRKALFFFFSILTCNKKTNDRRFQETKIQNYLILGTQCVFQFSINHWDNCLRAKDPEESQLSGSTMVETRTVDTELADHQLGRDPNQAGSL